MQEFNPQLIYAVLVGIAIGIPIGIAICRSAKKPSTALTTLQLTSVAMFFMYIVFSALINQPASEIIAIALISLTGGEAIGSVIQRKLNK